MSKRIKGLKLTNCTGSRPRPFEVRGICRDQKLPVLAFYKDAKRAISYASTLIKGEVYSYVEYTTIFKN